MSDDIVERLKSMRVGDEVMLQDEQAIHRAADEIERLRADIDKLRAAGEAMDAFMVGLPCYCVEGSNGEINETCEACGLAMDWRDALRG